MRKRVLITGASRGLGAAIGRRFHSAGDVVIAHSKSGKDSGEWSGVLSYSSICGDLRIASETERIAQACGPRLDLFVCNAAVKEEGGIGSITEGGIRTVLETNLIAPIRLTHRLWPALKAASGMIVFINSIAGKEGGASESLYSASKFGLRGFAQSLQFDATRDGVTVLSVFLGAMQTDMTRNRPNHRQLIQPSEAARVIFDLCVQRPSLRVTEADIARRIYHD